VSAVSRTGRLSRSKKGVSKVMYFVLIY
jgi:hypothetical protein